VKEGFWRDVSVGVVIWSVGAVLTVLASLLPSHNLRARLRALPWFVWVVLVTVLLGIGCVVALRARRRYRERHTAYYMPTTLPGPDSYLEDQDPDDEQF
jgi:hypothetical protein